VISVSINGGKEITNALARAAYDELLPNTGISSMR